MNVEEIQAQLRSDCRDATTLVVRRADRIYQMNIPAFLSDGDGASVFLLEGPGGSIRLTDLGQTLVRLGYSREIRPRSVDDLARIARRHGVTLENGSLSIDCSMVDILAGALSLVQVQAAAESALSKGPRSVGKNDRFRDSVQGFLREEFKKDVEFGRSDSEGAYVIDAVLRVRESVVGLSIVPSNLEAERAVISKLTLAESIGAQRWVAVTSDADKLATTSRFHLEREFEIPAPKFDPARVRAGILREIALRPGRRCGSSAIRAFVSQRSWPC